MHVKLEAEIKKNAALSHGLSGATRPARDKERVFLIFRGPVSHEHPIFSFWVQNCETINVILSKLIFWYFALEIFKCPFNKSTLVTSRTDLIYS